MADITSVDLDRLRATTWSRRAWTCCGRGSRRFAEALMNAEADAACGAPYRQVSEERVNYCNGYRDRRWDTHAETTELTIPKPREDSYCPGWLLERRRPGWRRCSVPARICRSR